MDSANHAPEQCSVARGLVFWLSTEVIANVYRYSGELLVKEFGLRMVCTGYAAPRRRSPPNWTKRKRQRAGLSVSLYSPDVRNTFGIRMAAAASAQQVLALPGFTTARVAEKACVSVGLLYQYFPNKTAILFRLPNGGGRPSCCAASSRTSRDRRSNGSGSNVRKPRCGVALNSAAPVSRDAPEAREARMSGTRTSSFLFRRRCPRPRKRRASAGDLITTTLSQVGKHFSESTRIRLRQRHGRYVLRLPHAIEPMKLT
jgi:hypothetical protein